MQFRRLPIHFQKTASRPLRRKPLTAAVASAILLIAPAVLITIPTTTHAQEQASSRQYDIPAGPLGSVLNRFAGEAGVFISADGLLTQGRTSQGVRGNLSVAQGLDQVLKDTGLKAVRQANGTYLLQEAIDAHSVLPAVRVVGSNDGTTEGTGGYASAGASSTATRLGLSLRETPQSVSVVTRQRMDDQNLLSVTDVLTQTTGISVLQNGADSTDGITYYSRGFTIENYQMDGVPLNTSQSRQNQIVDLAFYDRVEVVRGAAGLTTGVGTPSAAINLVRKKPTREFQASVTGSVGSWDNYRGEADVSAPLTESGNVRGRVVGVRQDSNSFIDRASFTKDMFYGILEVDVDPTLSISTGVEYQKYDSDGTARAGLPLYFSDGSTTNFPRSANASASWGSYNHENVAYFASLDKYFANGWRAKANFTHRRTAYDGVIGYAVSGRPNPDGTGLSMFASELDSEPRQNSLDAYVSGPFELLGRRHELVLGMNVSKTRYSGPSYGWAVLGIPNIFQWDGNFPERPAATVSGYSSFSSTESAAYATVRFKPTDALSVIVGSRVSNWEQDNQSWSPAGVETASLHREENGVVTPYAGVVFDMNEAWSAYGSYTSIFKPQNNRDVDGNYLDPVEGKAYEIGVKGELFQKRLNLSAAVFQIEQDNFAQQILPLTPVTGYPDEFAYRAAKGTVSRGLELEASGELLPGWQASLGASYSRAKDAEGVVINSAVPRTQVKFFTSYKLTGDWSKMTLGGGATWQSKASDTIGPNGERFVQQDYAVVHLFGRYQFDRNLSASLNINNLFDKTYLLSPWSTYYGAPRNATLSLRYQF